MSTKHWTDEVVSRAIHHWYTRHGRLPRKRDYRTDPTLPSYSTVWRTFRALQDAPSSCAMHPLVTCRMPTPARAAALVYVICVCGRARLVPQHVWETSGARAWSAPGMPLQLTPDPGSPG